MHILIIEDEEQLCRSMAEGLRMDGYETDTCFDGEEGLELCMTENYDLILLDLNLPGIDGLEILRQFRTFNRSEERRVGKECLRLCRSRWSPYH